VDVHERDDGFTHTPISFENIDELEFANEDVGLWEIEFFSSISEKESIKNQETLWVLFRQYVVIKNYPDKVVRKVQSLSILEKI
jgi:hypothetical protein